MAILTTVDLQMLKQSSAAAAAGARTARRRRISPEAGRGLELLGHAIEYLTDEYIHEGGSFAAEDAQVEAIQMLMRLNRQIYFECPQVPTLKEKLFSLLRLA